MDNIISKTEEWFYSNILYPRYLRTIIWTGVIQTVIFLSSIVFCNFLTQPINELLTLGELFQFSNVISLLSLVLLTFCLVLVHLRNVKAAPKVAASLWMRIISWANIERVLYIACIALIYVFLETGLSNLCGFRETIIVKKENFDKPCFSEKPIAMLTLHLYVGMIVGISYFKFHHYSVKFESVRQLKVYTIKMKLREAGKLCAKRAFTHLIRFIAGYFTVGSFAKLCLFFLNDVSFCNGSFISFATIRELFSFKFFLISLVTTYVGLITWEIISIISQVFLTERCEFSLESNLTPQQFCQLTNAIKCDNCPLLKYLALLDLKTLTELSEKRRSHIFTVSLPGGHPYIWNAILNENLSAISTFTSSLYDILAGKSNLMVQKMKIEPKNNNSEEPGPKRSPFKLRDIADNYTMEKPFNSTHVNVNATSYINTISNTPNLFFNKIKLYLPLGIPISFIRFLTTEYVDKNLENAFYSCQPIIWSIQALTSIIIASHGEDNYGVVQWSLGKILMTFLELNTVLEKIIRPKRNGVNTRICQTQQSLKMAVNNGLYRIVAMFHSNLNYLDLTEEQIQRLQCYKI